MAHLARNGGHAVPWLIPPEEIENPRSLTQNESGDDNLMTVLLAYRKAGVVSGQW